MHVLEQPSPLTVLLSSHNVLGGEGSIIIPSPQASLQTLAVVIEPSVQLQLVSTTHTDEQPSPSFVFPSSQKPLEGNGTFPSPQISTQELAVEESPKVQVQLVSTEHVLDQPSLLSRSPSSQYPATGVTTRPSPHKSMQVSAVVELPPVHE